jgi:hypothetical protein
MKTILKKISACPGWLDLSEDRRSFVCVPGKAEIMRKIFELSIGGLGSYSIANHVLPLMDFVRHLQARGLSVPSVDPEDGGIFARALFLQETPGPKAVGTYVMSQDNPDGTARNMKRTLGEAGFLRSTWFCGMSFRTASAQLIGIKMRQLPK